MPPVGQGTTSSPHSASHVIWATRVPRCRHCIAHQKEKQDSALSSQTSWTLGFLWSLPKARHKSSADIGLVGTSLPGNLSTSGPGAVVIPPRPMPQARDSQRLLPWQTCWPPPRAGYRAKSRARGDTGRWEPRGVSWRPPSSKQYASLPLQTQRLRNSGTERGGDRPV